MRWKALGKVSRKEANAAVRALVGSGTSLKPESVTFQYLAKKWETIVVPVWKYSTRKGHLYILQTHLMPTFGTLSLDQISNLHVQQFISELQRRNYAPHTIDHCHNVLSTILSKAVMWGYITSNPAHGIDLLIFRRLCRRSRNGC